MLTRVRETIEKYEPKCEQESADQAQMLAFLDRNPDCLTRENGIAHFTASSWIVDPARTQALMIYHNIYQSWSWTGGHADGDSDLLAVALREAEEETGAHAVPASTDPISVESLCVFGHVKRGRYVSAHIHMNVSYLLIADPDAPVRPKKDENSGVRWIACSDVREACSEPDMQLIYEKLINRT